MQGRSAQYSAGPVGPPPKPPPRRVGGSSPHHSPRKGEGQSPRPTPPRIGEGLSLEVTPQHYQPAVQASISIKDEEYRKAARKVSHRVQYNCIAKTLELGLILLLIVVVVLVIVAGSL